MIIVTGTARSRTSMTMGVLDKFGHPYVGDKFVNEDFEKPHNLNGIYEKNGDSVLGYMGPVVNGAMKIILTALFPNSVNGMKGTSQEVLKKATTLMCLRHPYEIANSVSRIYKEIPITTGYVLWEYCSFLSWLDYNRWFMNNLYTINTDGYFRDPLETISDIAYVAGCPKGGLGIEDAVKSIKPSQTYQQTRVHEWPEDVVNEGRLVDDIYKCLVENNLEGAMKLASDYVNDWRKNG